MNSWWTVVDWQWHLPMGKISFKYKYIHTTHNTARKWFKLVLVVFNIILNTSCKLINMPNTYIIWVISCRKVHVLILAHTHPSSLHNIIPISRPINFINIWPRCLHCRKHMYVRMYADTHTYTQTHTHEVYMPGRGPEARSEGTIHTSLDCEGYNTRPLLSLYHCLSEIIYILPWNRDRQRNIREFLENRSLK